MHVRQDQWLSDMLGVKVFRLDWVEEPSQDFRGNQPRLAMLEHILIQSPVFVYAKTSVTAHEYIHWMENAKFHLVDTNIRLGRRTLRDQESIDECKMRFATPKDELRTVELARRAFRFSRFHLDPRISQPKADTIKAEWARNFFSGKRGDAMIVAEIKGKIVGFLLLIYDRHRGLVIDLLAVDAQHRRKGVAGSMIAFAENRCTDFDHIFAGTQVANIASTRMYEKNGFRLASAEYVYHYHN